jgi:hypothetical protein
MEKAVNEPILIIKTSWGGRSLHTDFRSPSAVPYEWSEFELNQNKERGDDIAKNKAEKVEATGVAYRMMISHVNKVLGDIKRIVPEYDPKQGYEVAGFVWFQGFNDYVSDWTYDKRDEPGGYKMYSDLLAPFIRDVRKDVKAPKMPFIIGVMGIDGEQAAKNPSPMKHFRDAQTKVASMSEFKGSVIAVQTAPFWDDELQGLQERMETYWPDVDTKVTAENDDSWENKMKHMEKKFKPSEWKKLKCASDGGCHYVGAAKIMAPIGKSFADALKPFLATKR